MIRKQKLYVKPRKAFESSRIAEENKLVEKYGLKNKREVWKTLAKVNYFRSRAKDLTKFSQEEQEGLFNKLKALGLKTNVTADVLDLKVEDLLERRLPTVVAKKGFASTVKQARQMVVHKKILISGRVVSSPSYTVKVLEENLISVKKKVRKPKVEEPKEEAPAEEARSAETEQVKEESKE